MIHTDIPSHQGAYDCTRYLVPGTRYLMNLLNEANATNATNETNATNATNETNETNETNATGPHLDILLYIGLNA